MPSGTFVYSFDNKGLSISTTNIEASKTSIRPIINTSKSFTTLNLLLEISGDIITVTIDFTYNTIIGDDGLSFKNIYKYYVNNTVKSTINIKKFDGIPLSRETYQFFQLYNLEITATDLPTILPNTKLNNAFYNCTNFNSDISSWDVSNVIEMNSMFENATKFNNKYAPMKWNCSSLISATNFGLNSGLYGSGTNAKYDINSGNAVRSDELTSIETPTKQLTSSNSSVLKEGTFKFSVSGNITAFTEPHLSKIPIINSASFNDLDIEYETSLLDSINTITYYISYTYKIILGDDGLSFKNVYNFYKNVDVNILEFDNIPLSKGGEQFAYLEKLKITATDSPIFLSNTSLSKAFYWCLYFEQNISNWNFSNVTTDMSYMFYGCIKFNQNINGWDVSNVTNMSYMFYGCSSFNQNINNWDVSKVINMSNMFYGCITFNQPISNWTLSKVTNMSNIFNGCTNFNQNINGTTVLNVTDMSYMFNNCINFNQNISGWVISNVTNMSYMFYGCTNFNNTNTPINWTCNTSLNAPNFGDNSGLYPRGNYYINPGYAINNANKKTIQTPSYTVGQFIYTFDNTGLAQFDKAKHIPIIKNNTNSFIYFDVNGPVVNSNITRVTISFYYVTMIGDDGLTFNIQSVKDYYKQNLITITSFGYVPLSKVDEYKFQDASGLNIKVLHNTSKDPYVPLSAGYNKRVYYREYTSQATYPDLGTSYNINMPIGFSLMEVYLVGGGGSGGAGGGDVGKGREGTNGAGGGGGGFGMKLLATTLARICGPERDSKKYHSGGTLSMYIGGPSASVSGKLDSNSNGINGINGNNSWISLNNVTLVYTTQVGMTYPGTTTNNNNFPQITVTGGGGGGGGHPSSKATPGSGSTNNNIRDGESSLDMVGGKSGYSLNQLDTTPKFKRTDTNPYGNGGNGTEGKAAPNNNPTGAGYAGYGRIYYIT